MESKIDEPHIEWNSKSAASGGTNDREVLSINSLRHKKASTPTVIGTEEEIRDTSPFPTLIPMVLKEITPETTGEEPNAFFVTASPPKAVKPVLTDGKENVILVPPETSGNETLVTLTDSSHETETKSSESTSNTNKKGLTDIRIRPTQLGKPLEGFSQLVPKSVKTGVIDDKFVTWSIRVKPHETDAQSPKSSATSATTENEKPTPIEEIGSLFRAYMEKLKTQTTLNKDNNFQGSTEFGMSYGNIINMTQPIKPISLANLTHARSILKPVIPHPQCGGPPNFEPCVPIVEANKRLLQCCQSKLLPPGCLNLCRYDISQKKIRAALDAGQCGILHVTPIVGCASGGRDNTDCCRHKRVAAKSGPQCEMFCRAGDGIRGIGLQHLVCNLVLDDLLTCHHAGLKN